jgi:hypothetical protein
MFYRRFLYLGQFVAAVVLPTWVLVSRGLLDDGIGWELLVYVIICPILSISMLIVGGLIAARASARTARAVSWLDAGLLSVWWLSIIAYGFWAWTVLAVLVVLLTVAMFWSSVWQFVTETRARFRGLMAGLEQTANPLANHPGASSTPETPRVIIIDTDQTNGGR